MSSHEVPDEKLREAFQALEASAGACSESDLDRVWRAVSGELPVSERHELVDRMATDPLLAEAWRLAHELQRPGGTPQETRVDNDAPASWWRLPSWAWASPTWLAAAAVLFVGVALGVLIQLEPSPRDEFRDAGGEIVESRLASDAPLPRDAFVLRWTPAPEGSRYHVTVTTEDLRVLADASDLTVPELVVGREALTPVPAGARVLWHVDVALPDGGSASSRTFVVRVR